VYLEAKKKQYTTTKQYTTKQNNTLQTNKLYKMSAQHTGKEMGLIKGLSKRNRQLSWAEEDKINLMKSAIETIIEISRTLTNGRRIKKFIADYIIKSGQFYGLFKGTTTIGVYTNKRGVRSQVHFKTNGQYLGTCKKYGDTPIDCYYMKRITATDTAEDIMEQFNFPGIDEGIEYSFELKRK